MPGNPLRAREAYEQFLYTLTARTTSIFPSISSVPAPNLPFLIQEVEQMLIGNTLR